MICKNINDITPVDNINGIFFKRDDLYIPFDDIPLSGGKVRQCQCLINNNLNLIRDKYQSTIVSGTGMLSPQGIIISKIANTLGLKSMIYIGNTSKESLQNNILMKNIIFAGNGNSYIDLSSRFAYENVLLSTIRGDNQIYGERFLIKFGINLVDNPDAILDSVGNQVCNLPNDLDYLIVPVGSGVTFAGILLGLKKFGIKPRHVVGIQISGYDRTKLINSILGDTDIEYEFKISKDYNYHHPLKLNINNSDIGLDWLYESKAYEYVYKYMPNIFIDSKVCFWLVGNSTMVRTNLYCNNDTNISNYLIDKYDKCKNNLNKCNLWV